MTLLASYGTRPEYIKLKPIIDKFGDKCRVLFTGQHTDLIDNKYDYVVTVCGLGNRLDTIIASVMGELTYILKADPSISHVIVQGDTTSALAVAISAFHHKLKIVHLEAGLRTNDLYNPYPEEGYRRMISQIADIHLCPTYANSDNLSCSPGRAFVVGNTVIDSLVKYKHKCEYKNIVLVTMHRRENHDKMMDWFVEIDKLAKKNRKLKFIFPVHHNPNVRKHIDLLKHVSVVEPMPREDLLDILVKAKMVITDSGGLQEECSYFNKVCLVCRKVTERTEVLGTSSFLVQYPEMLGFVFKNMINKYEIDAPCPYGDGNSSEIIYNILMSELNDYSADSQYTAKG